MATKKADIVMGVMNLLDDLKHQMVAFSSLPMIHIIQFLSTVLEARDVLQDKYQ